LPFRGFAGGGKAFYSFGVAFERFVDFFLVVLPKREELNFAFADFPEKKSKEQGRIEAKLFTSKYPEIISKMSAHGAVLSTSKLLSRYLIWPPPAPAIPSCGRLRRLDKILKNRDSLNSFMCTSTSPSQKKKMSWCIN
jgi:hypothetical protein